MNNKSFVNRLSFVLVALLYLSFYLFSPLFHYHHENLGLEEEKIDYHSHLLQEITQNAKTTETNHTLDQNDGHNHSVVINTLITNLPTRLAYTPNVTLLFNKILDLELHTNSVEYNYSEDIHLGKTLKDKCIHSATNVSPPALFTA